MDLNQLSLWFFHALTEKVPSSLNEGRRLTIILSNDDGVFNYFIKIVSSRNSMINH